MVKVLGFLQRSRFGVQAKGLSLRFRVGVLGHLMLLSSHNDGEPDRRYNGA